MTLNPSLALQPQIHLDPEPTETSDPGPGLGLEQDLEQDFAVGGSGGSGASAGVEHLPFAEVSSLLDPNMKGSKARKYLISYDEIRRRLQPPEKMSLRSIAAYTRVSRGPASKKTLQESLSVLGLSPSTTTAVSSSFSKLTEGDTRALCEDMRDFSQDYIDYENIAKQLIPKVNTVQHWSKIIETKNHLEDMRRCLQEPANSQAFDSATHGLGLGMIHVVLDMVSSVIQHQVRILSGTANANADQSHESGPSPPRRNRKRQRRFNQNEAAAAAAPQRTAREAAILKAKSGGRGRKKARQDGGQTAVAAAAAAEVEATPEPQMEGGNVLLLTVGYEAVSNELTTESHITESHITESHITESHITESHITESHITESHITESHSDEPLQS
ncbi:transcription factor AP-2-delta [Boleophthalmus pectinirostris]|uniref:transcription factor AP-2-delta n=1 Tax=Boleophthalmus pectinirostris TaxID=150288 RepID=UPI00242FE337|nr:transcription factor AP-2-delta [Boleophthalmus pectinirostris]